MGKMTHKSPEELFVTPLNTYKRGELNKKPKKGYNFTTTTAMLENITSKKEPTLFPDELPQVPAPTDTQLDIVDKKGKRVYLSPRQNKLYYAFVEVVDSIKEQKKVADYIKALPDKVEWKEEHKSPVSAIIDINKLAKKIYGKDRIGSKQVDYIRDDLITLSSTIQEFRVKDSKGGTHILRCPILNWREYEYINKDGEKTHNLFEVTFGDIFLYGLNWEGGYQIIPNNILSLWNKTGVNTELFVLLLNILVYVRGKHVAHSNKICRAKQKELRKEKVPEDSIKEQIGRLRRELLTYKESISSILGKLIGNTYYEIKKGKKYLKGIKLKNDLKQATDALKDMGIITQYKETTGADGSILCNFVLNDKWIEEQTEVQKKILSPDPKQ
jgi:hypothetical protein